MDARSDAKIIVGAYLDAIRDEPGDVAVTTRYGLNRWARSLPTVLSDQHVDATFDQVRRSTTWRATTSRDQ